MVSYHNGTLNGSHKWTIATQHRESILKCWMKEQGTENYTCNFLLSSKIEKTKPYLWVPSYMSKIII